MQTLYEWDYETVDVHGDVQDHNHADKLSMFTDSDKTDSLVLIRNSGNEAEGLTERYWAYVKNGKLPEYFQDSNENNICKVPARFHAELAKYVLTNANHI